MKKNRAILVMVLTVVLIGLLSFTSIVGFGPDRLGSARNIILGLDLAGGVSITYQAVGDTPSSEDMADTIYKLQRRVEQYSTEATVYQEGDNRINIEIPGVSDANKILEELGTPGSLYFIAQTDSEGNQNYSYIGPDEWALNKSIEELQADGSIVLTGTDVENAKAGQVTNNMNNTEVVVELKMTEEGTKKFAEATKKAYAAGESIGIYYDGKFISVPNVNAEITDGNAQITGMKDFQEAEAIASTIRIGGLQVELEEIRSNVVGAQLGEEAISTSLKAGAIGLAIVIIFMIAVYLLPGLVAGIALIIYTGLMLVMLNAFDITLTLPGIAGIILSIGMAVDANVIIYARIKEEIAAGSNVKTAIRTGYQKAFSAIIDGNITTLIAAIVLGLKGSGSVKGFASTLALGIVLSMFTALVISRLLMTALYTLGLRDAKYYGKAKEHKTINFLGKKNIFFAVSLLLIVCAPVFMAINAGTTGEALNYSLEFKGGTSTNVVFNEDLSIAQLDAEVKPVVEKITKDANIQLTKVANSNEVNIKTRELNLDEREALNKALVENFGVDDAKISAENISSTVSSEMRSDAIIAVVIATLCMLVYIWFRFKDVRFAASAVLALIHDVLVVLAFYAVAKISVGNTFIACMLTIVGYSINATIVIFDRIRENLGESRNKEKIAEIVNLSITQTLTRSIYTSFTTFIMVAVLFVMGVSAIREFALPLMVGIVCGAYSSVCITGALWYVMKTKVNKKVKLQKKDN
ncbi:MAG: protein translocase subunit SecD [Clostridiales bacterium]|nr:protein translocase subunit SecD [Clostridiales bacterium]